MKTFDGHTEKVQKQFNRQADAYAQTKQARKETLEMGITNIEFTHQTVVYLLEKAG